VLDVLQLLAGALLLLATPAAAWLLFASLLRSYRWGLVVAAPAVGVFLLAGAELLSLADGFRALPLTIWWAAGLAAAMTGVLLVRRRRDADDPLLPRVDLTGVSRWVMAYLGVWAGLLSLIALTAAPNNWDSLSYHMARVANWVAHGSVEPYASYSKRQIFLAPWTEYAQAHLQAVTSGDRLANVVQLLAAMATVVVMTRVAANLGLDRRAQAWTAVGTATLPMLVAQAPTTQNDLTLTLWIAVVAALATAPEPLLVRRWHLLALAAAAGLAVSTKGTAFFFLPPILVLYAVRLWRRDRRWLIPAAGAGLLAMGAVNAGLWLRNLDLYGSILGPSEGHVEPAAAVTTPVIGAVQTIGLQLGVPLGEEVNGKIASFLDSTLGLFGLDINDPGVLGPGYTFIVQFGNREDTAGSLAHLLLLIVALIVLVGRRSFRRYLPYGLVIAGGLVLFLSLARFSHYNNRYLLAPFTLAVPVMVAGLVLLPRWMGRVALVGLAVSSGFWLLASDLRPLVPPADSVVTTPRSADYFTALPERQREFEAAVDALVDADVHRVGLVSDEDAWEYPLWALADLRGADIEYDAFGVTNATAELAATSPPDAIVCLIACQPPEGQWSGQSFGELSVYLRER
jgi:hypothetical protein